MKSPRIPKTLMEFQDLASRNLSNNIDSDYDEDEYPQLKVQLIESNLPKIPPQIDEFSAWKKMEDSRHWYISSQSDGKHVMLNKISDRVWAAYTLMSIDDFSRTINKWIRKTTKLDNCWISTKQMEWIGKEMKWKERGIGITFKDTLSSAPDISKVSLKAWYGNNRLISDMLGKMKDVFSTNSIRWKSDTTAKTSSEWYSNGKITFHASEDMNEIIHCVSEMAGRYNESLNHATKLRDEEMGSFEFSFKQKIPLEEYSAAAGKGRGNLKLWMTEIESHDDFKRLQGVDLHTWDRVFLDLGNDYAYMTIPGNGCVNAVPRLVSVQGETALGKTEITYNGNEIFV